MASPVLPKLVGQRVKRREDPRLVQGRATYVDDIKVAGMQHLAFKRSDIAHGRIRAVDVSAAQAMDGVEAVFTGAQIAELVAPMPIGTPWMPSWSPMISFRRWWIRKRPFRDCRRSSTRRFRTTLPCRTCRAAR